MKLIEMASHSSKQSRSKDAEKEPLSFAERFEAIHKASQESGSDRHSVTIVNTNGRKLVSVKNGKKRKTKQKSNTSSTSESDSLFDSSSDDSPSAQSSPQPQLLKDAVHRSDDNENVAYNPNRDEITGTCYDQYTSRPLHRSNEAMHCPSNGEQ